MPDDDFHSDGITGTQGEPKADFDAKKVDIDEPQVEMDVNPFEFEMLTKNVIHQPEARFASLSADPEAYTSKCKNGIESIFFRDFCHYMVMREQVVIFVGILPADEIIDRDITAHIPGETNPYGCDGWQMPSVCEEFCTTIAKA